MSSEQLEPFLNKSDFRDLFQEAMVSLYHFSLHLNVLDCISLPDGVLLYCGLWNVYYPSLHMCKFKKEKKSWSLFIFIYLHLSSSITYLLALSLRCGWCAASVVGFWQRRDWSRPEWPTACRERGTELSSASAKLTNRPSLTADVMCLYAALLSQGLLTWLRRIFTVSLLAMTRIWHGATEEFSAEAKSLGLRVN